MRKRVFLLFSSFLALAMVAVIPSELVAARWASPEPPAEPAAAQQEEAEELVKSILAELNQAKGMTTDEGVIGQINGIIDMVRKLEWLEFTDQEDTALRLKKIIAENLEQLINELPLTVAGATTALAAATEANPLHEELVRVRAKIERLIALETPLEAVPPEIPTLSRVPETERLIVYSAKFLCGPAFGKEGVQRGSYSTAVNVHNPHDGRVVLYKKAVIAQREDEPRGRISEFHRVVLGPDEAIEIDCLDIYGLLGPDEEEPDLTTTGQQQTLTALTPSTAEGSGGTQIQTSDIVPVSSLVRFIKGFVVIYASAPLDVVAVYTASTPVGFSLDVEYLSPSTASTIPYTPPTEGEECPQGCRCLTREEALKAGLTAWCGGEVKICEYDENQQPIRYCFEEPTEQVSCPDGCECLTGAAAQEKGWASCPGETRQCGTDSAGNAMHCFEVPTEEGECPQGCECLALTEAEAARQDLERCLDASCGTDVTGKAMYCYRRTTQVQCPDDCQCLAMSPDEAEKQGLEMCLDVSCGTDADGNAMYCYRRASQVQCPDDCYCLAMSLAAAEEQGLEQCLDVSCGTDAAGNVMYCYREATEDECPAGCQCLSDREARNLGYTLCGGKRIPCGYVPGAAEKWCYEPAVPTRISIEPTQASNLIGTEHEVTVTVYDKYGSPIPSLTVTITVSGANSMAPVTLTTNTNGQVSFDYVGNKTGNDTIVATIAAGLQATAFKSWYQRGAAQ
jgi:hypothetical protein